MSNALETQVGGTHYKVLPYQPIELIGELRMDYFQGCIVKYISRDKNNKIEDLQKAIHYCKLAEEVGVGIKYVDSKHSQSLKYEIGKYVKMNNLPEICSLIILNVLRNQYKDVIEQINTLITQTNKQNNMERKEVYNKYNGKCAYCGCDITLKEMQIDHLVPLYRNDSDEQLDKWGKIRGTNDISNLMPSCRSCNHYKSTFTLDEFREQLMIMRERLNKQHKIYSISKRYGLIEEKQNKIVFFFEKPKLTCYLGDDMSN